MNTVLIIDDRQHATVLAALRLYQRELNFNGGAVPQDVVEIATNSGAVVPMDDEAIDALVDGINGGALTYTRRFALCLKNIIAEAPDTAPEAEDYDDTESAFDNGHEVAAWKAAVCARALLRRIAPDDPIAHEALFEFTASDSVEFVANVGRLSLEGASIDSHALLQRLISVAQDIEAFETSDGGEHAPGCAQRVHGANECNCGIAAREQA